MHYIVQNSRNYIVTRYNKMTPKQLMTWRFGHEYCVDYDPTAAAIRAGWSKESAQQAAYRLLKKPEVQQLSLIHI